MKKAFHSALAVLILLCFGPASQAQEIFIIGVYPGVNSSPGTIVTSTGSVAVTDSQRQTASTPIDQERQLHSAAYLMLEKENKPHCRITSKFHATGHISHGYWFSSESKKSLGDEVILLSQNGDQASHWLECE